MTDYLDDDEGVTVPASLLDAYEGVATLGVLAAITAVAALAVGAWHWESGALLAVYAAALAGWAVTAWWDEIRPARRKVRR